MLTLIREVIEGDDTTQDTNGNIANPSNPFIDTANLASESDSHPQSKTKNRAPYTKNSRELYGGITAEGGGWESCIRHTPSLAFG